MNLFGVNIEKAPQGVYVGRSSLTNVTQWFYEAIAGKPSSSGEPVNEQTAMQISAVFACVRVIAETTAQVPIHYYQRTQQGKEINLDDKREMLVNEEPHFLIDSFTYRETTAYHLCFFGNAYSVIERDNNNVPQSINPVHPQDIEEINISQDGKRMFYKVKGYDAEIPDRNMLHFKVLSKDGYIGRSFLETAQEEFGGALAEQKFSNRFWQNGAAPGLVIKTPHELSQEAHNRLKHNAQNFKQDKAGHILPLDGGSEVENIGIPQKDAQFLETKKFSKEQIASIFRVPLPLINDLSNANYSNVTALTLNFAKYTMAPWFARLEGEMNRKLRPRTEQGRRNFFAFDMDGLMRGDAVSRAQYYKDLYSIGALTGNEVRDKEGFNKLDIPAMDVPHKQLQDVPVDTDTASLKKNFEANGKKNGKYATNNN